MAKLSGNKSNETMTTAMPFCIAGMVFFLLDGVTKIFIDAQYQPGDVIAGPFLGLFDFMLVHNTGAAWGMFGDSTVLLGIFSVLVCIALGVYFFWYQKGNAPLLQAIGLGMVVAGGLGNASDRFTLGYVVDFIHTLFIDFPVFNIADIGVTCGIALFLISAFAEEFGRKGEQR